jgi:hypothetical protein
MSKLAGLIKTVQIHHFCLKRGFLGFDRLPLSKTFFNTGASKNILNKKGKKASEGDLNEV